MAMTASPPPQLPSAANDAYIDQLDEDIAKVRAEIANLTSRKSLLSASLLSSSKVQAALQANTYSNTQNPPDTPLAALADRQSQHNQVNVHRLAFGITSFPFTDPSPETSDEPLLGVRFDIPSHDGKFDQAPYYLFCRKQSRTLDGSSTLTVHHHTIPAYVPLQGLLTKYLPQSTDDDGDGDDEGYDSPRSSSPRHMSSSELTHSAQPKQDLHALVTQVYMHLASRANRKAAISLLADPLHSSLSSMDATGEDCRFVRLIWHDGLVGRMKIDDDGTVERAVVFGDEGRMQHLERMLTHDEMGNGIGIMELGPRLDEVARFRGRQLDVDVD